MFFILGKTHVSSRKPLMQTVRESTFDIFVFYGLVLFSLA